MTATLFTGGDSTERNQPIGPPPTHTTTPLPKAALPGWTGVLRPNGSRAVVFAGHDPATDLGLLARDPRDAEVGAVDIRALRTTGFVADRRWTLNLRATHPTATKLDNEHRVIEYGVVVDGEGDGVADCAIGINNDAAKPGDYRTWVLNLHTAAKTQKDGGPYGYPFDFGFHRQQVTLFFLAHTSAPCAAFGDSATYYAYSSVTENGRVTAWDYAPDTAWLSMREQAR